jgi:Bacterial SH3 domain
MLRGSNRHSGVLRATVLAGCIATVIQIAAPAAASEFCPVLKSPDGFVALRAGPGTRFPVIAQMRADDEVQALEGREGPWMQVRHWRGAERLDEKTRAKFRTGWAHRRYIGDCG